MTVTRSSPTLVDRDPATVRYLEVADDIGEIRLAWPALEDAVGSLRGRRFVAVFDPVAGWYRACVEVRPSTGDVTAAELLLPETVVPGGRYVRIRLRGAPPAVYDEIGPAYEALESSYERDGMRPSLEIYRRLDEVDVVMPVAPTADDRGRREP